MENAAKLALIFPGQGSQWVGMGRALCQAFPEAQQTFAESDAALGEKLTQLCSEGPEDKLQLSANAQPAILTYSIALLRAVQARRPLMPLGIAGHSLGEYTALVAASTLPLGEALHLVRARALCMEAVGTANGNIGMLAILGMGLESVTALCAQAQTAGPVNVAIYNCPGQVVVGGVEAALNKIAELAKAQGAKRVQRLAMSVASHTPLMLPAAGNFAPLLEAAPLQTPVIPLVGNVKAEVINSVAALRAELLAQLTHALIWPDSMRKLKELGADTFWEIGPRNVLTGIARHIEGAPSGLAITSAEDILSLLV